MRKEERLFLEEELAKPLEAFGQRFRKVETRLVQIDTTLRETIPEIKDHLKELNSLAKLSAERLTRQETICEETRRQANKNLVKVVKPQEADNSGLSNPKILIATFAVIQVVISGLFAMVITLLQAR